MTRVITQPGNTVVTDLGRRRGPAFGLPVNGALDQHAARVANALVANRQDAPLLELTAFDFACRVDADALIAVTGAPAVVTIDGYREAQWQPLIVEAGQTVRIGGITDGLRVYLAVLGSVEAPQLMGSCAPDTVLGFGERLRTASELRMLRHLGATRHGEFGVPLFHFRVPLPGRPRPMVVDVVDGPDLSEFGDTAERIFDSPYRVGQQSNHVGLRLAGAMPQRRVSGEVLSRGVPVGAVEAPAGDELLILHRGRGVTAGYPVLGVVTESGLDLLAQARPDDLVSFRRTTVDAARAETRARRASIDELGRSVSRALAARGLTVDADGDDRWRLPLHPTTTKEY